MRLLLILAAIIHAFGSHPALAADPPAASLAEAWPAPDGLVVQVGATSAEALAGFAGPQRGRLVHGLTADDATRDRLRSALHGLGLHPLVSVATWHGGPRLPYADRLVNLLILDRDALGATAPSEDEARRVVALHARDGSVAWTKDIAKTRSTIAAGGRGSNIVDRSVINTAPAVVDGKVVIAGGTHLGRLEFAPDEAAAAISARLSAPPAKKR